MDPYLYITEGITILGTIKLLILQKFVVKPNATHRQVLVPLGFLAGVLMDQLIITFLAQIMKITQSFTIVWITHMDCSIQLSYGFSQEHLFYLKIKWSKLKIWFNPKFLDILRQFGLYILIKGVTANMRIQIKFKCHRSKIYRESQRINHFYTDGYS